jgi:hypothetical protein
VSQATHNSTIINQQGGGAGIGKPELAYLHTAGFIKQLQFVGACLLGLAAVLKTPTKSQNHHHIHR